MTFASPWRIVHPYMNWSSKFQQVPKQHVGVDLVSETDSFGCRTFGGQFMTYHSIRNISASKPNGKLNLKRLSWVSAIGYRLVGRLPVFPQFHHSKGEKKDKRAKTLAYPICQIHRNLHLNITKKHRQKNFRADHHPPAPSDELLDITTTVDPSYIISFDPETPARKCEVWRDMQDNHIFFTCRRRPELTIDESEKYEESENLLNNQ
ncbi:hypothetical protein HAX54_027272 [Datura stramonium]|uniref:Uncharacterized protein n=1 Tax=Datura stramonium TaxID=4076 RepID=A0ABS8V246_DATST|nr:hypothetical protein [Datura stramonium]